MVQEEERMKMERRGDVAEMELIVQEKFAVLVQDIYAFYPLLILFVERHRYEKKKLIKYIKSKNKITYFC